MSGTFEVVAAAVQVRVGNEFRHVARGARLPEGTDEEDMARLVRKGLLREVKQRAARKPAKPKDDSSPAEGPARTDTDPEKQPAKPDEPAPADK